MSSLSSSSSSPSSNSSSLSGSVVASTLLALKSWLAEGSSRDGQRDAIVSQIASLKGNAELNLPFEIKTSDGKTCLVTFLKRAVDLREYELIKCLIAVGANPNPVDRQWWPLPALVEYLDNDSTLSSGLEQLNAAQVIIEAIRGNNLGQKEEIPQLTAAWTFIKEYGRSYPIALKFSKLINNADVTAAIFLKKFLNSNSRYVGIIYETLDPNLQLGIINPSDGIFRFFVRSKNDEEKTVVVRGLLDLYNKDISRLKSDFKFSDDKKYLTNIKVFPYTIQGRVLGLLQWIGQESPPQVDLLFVQKP